MNFTLPRLNLRRGFTPIIVLLVVAVLAVATYFIWNKLNLKAPGNSAQPVTIKVGILSPLTKELSDYGISLRDGATLAAQEINNEGKVKIELVEKDEEGSPELSKKLAAELGDDPNVVGIIGPITSTDVLADGPVAGSKKVALISPSATNPKISGLSEYVFRVCPSDSQQGKELAAFVLNNLKTNRVAVLVDNAEKSKDYSQGLADVFAAEFKRLGGTVAVTDTYKTGDADYTRQLAAIKAAGDVKVIFLPGYTTEAALLSQAIKKQGLDIRVVGGDGVGEGVMNGELIKAGGAAVEGLIATSFFDPNDPAPDVQGFIKAYQAKFGKAPSWVAANSYDAMKVIAASAEKVGKADKVQIAQQISASKGVDGLDRMISFDKNGDVSSSILKLEIKGGKYQIFK
ncbi:MAG TPA: ABC transporter substrate-binding protein [Candidatus Saccharimonadales bacterium]|nr:ABC transporter substrate-binding protein [Candidatus Saccharimonadales bacterium]